MPASILLGRGQGLSEMPQATWEHYLSQVPAHSQSRLSFMTEDYHRIRYFVVKQLAYTLKPIEPEFISERLSIPLERVKTILEELERKLFFLVMNENGAVTWAFPVTVETTPHQIEFSSGERLYGA